MVDVHSDKDIQVADGMLIEWDVPVEMDDGIVLRADVFRPTGPGKYPVLMSYGPYGKGLTFQEGYPSTWNRLAAGYPEATAGTSNKYQNFEVADPEKWVPFGYACIRVDARGTGRSAGYLDPFSPRETRDFYDCIEWAGELPWSNGKVGLAGISYYAQNQWLVAAAQPPHLAAICPWEGSSDWYRELARHGGILCTFGTGWYESVVKPVQYGRGDNGPRSLLTGQLVCGDETLDAEVLAGNRIDYGGLLRNHEFDDETARERVPDLSKVTVPLLSAANWGGQGLHLRGNVEGFTRSGSAQKWLEVHGREHWAEFYTDYGVALQRRFFDHFLLGRDNGWEAQAPLLLNIRHVDGTFTRRDELAWPLPDTKWTTLFLDGTVLTPSRGAPGSIAFDALGGGVTFTTPPLEQETEITGPAVASLFIASSTTDADLFLVVRAFSPDGEELTFNGAIDPHSAVSKGWLRASQRKLDPVLSADQRPYHPHDESQPLTPGEVYQLDIEIWPMSVVLPAGYRLALTVRGKDWELPDSVEAGALLNFGIDLRGSGPFLHNDPADRPEAVFGGRTTVFTGGVHASWLRLPVIGRDPAAAE
jgi:hypothetical protein